MSPPPHAAPDAKPPPLAALTRAWRAFFLVLLSWSRASLLLILALVVLATDPPVTPPVVFSLTAVLVVLPGVGAALVRRAFRATAGVRGETLEIRCADVRVAVPCSAIARIEAWLLPLPGCGLWLRLGSGRRLRWGLLAEDPVPLLSALAEAGGAVAASVALRDWRVAFADARARRRAAPGRRRLLAALKFGLFALLPAGVLFNAHQHIAFGGLLGEYYIVGPGAWLRTLALYAATTAVYLVLYAAALRVPAEALALIVARRAPARAAAGRRVAELWCALGYYLGVPFLLALRFAP
jgi:hypothetical protein